jgi:hypothetical protein
MHGKVVECSRAQRNPRSICAAGTGAETVEQVRRRSRFEREKLPGKFESFSKQLLPLVPKNAKNEQLLGVKKSCFRRSSGQLSSPGK